MSIEAPIGKHRLTNLKIYIGFCIAVAIVFAYDGYLSKYEWSGRTGFYEKHVVDGKPSDTMVFNRAAPICLLAGAAALIVRLGMIKNRRLLAEDDKLVFSSGQKILYDTIQKIDKTHFKSRGIFTITYKDESGREIDRKIKDRDYDNLKPVLDLIVSKIS